MRAAAHTVVSVHDVHGACRGIRPPQLAPFHDHGVQFWLRVTLMIPKTNTRPLSQLLDTRGTAGPQPTAVHRTVVSKPEETVNRGFYLGSSRVSVWSIEEISCRCTRPGRRRDAR